MSGNDINDLTFLNISPISVIGSTSINFISNVSNFLRASFNWRYSHKSILFPCASVWGY